MNITRRAHRATQPAVRKRPWVGIAVTVGLVTLAVVVWIIVLITF